MLADYFAPGRARDDTHLKAHAAVCFGYVYQFLTNTLSTMDCKNPISSSTSIAEISNIPNGGISRWTGSRIGSVTRRTNPRNVLRLNTNHDEINLIKMNSTRTLSRPYRTNPTTTLGLPVATPAVSP